MAPTATWTLAPVWRAIDERRLLRHGLFWLVQLALVVVLLRYCVHMVSTLRLAIREAVVTLPALILSVYLLLYGVLPQLWQPERRAHIGWSLAGWLLLSQGLAFALRYLVVVPLHDGEHNPSPDYHFIYSTSNCFLLLGSAGAAASLRMYRHWWQEELANLHLTRENFQAELQLLKAQIHPHFLFNTLNSLYALTLKQSSQAPVVVERLTGLLHAVLTQSSAPLVPLADEVALLRNFIALERLRYGDRLAVEFDTDAGLPTCHIAPLLLLPLVENAFKHGAAEQVGRAHIRIALAVKGTTFTCLISNSKNPEDAPPSPTGIGLGNVRQRLWLLYPHRHRMEVEVLPDTFTVKLTMQLSGAAEAIATAPAHPLVLARPTELAASHSLAVPAHEHAA